MNKLDSIHAEFRYFDMEVLAGEPDFVTSLVRGVLTSLPKIPLTSDDRPDEGCYYA